PAGHHRQPRHNSLRVRDQHRLRAAETGLPKITPALSDYAGGMQVIARGAGTTANQQAGFSGAALSAFADLVERWSDGRPRPSPGSPAPKTTLPPGRAAPCR